MDDVTADRTARPRGLTFGSSGLDRAALLRASSATLSAAPHARILPLWRGKPLVTRRSAAAPPDPCDAAGLGWLAPGHAMLARPGAVEAPVFLGDDDGVPRFAVDLSGWAPPEPQGGPPDSYADRSVQVHPAGPPGAGFVDLRACMTALAPRAAELAATARALLEWHRRHRFCANCGAATKPEDGGWRRGCDACGAHHFPRTDPVVIMAVTRGDAMLVGRSPGWPQGMYSLLAGYVEPGETIEAAVRREVFEETAVRVGAVQYLVSQPWPFPASLMLACHGAAESTEIRIDPAEVEDAQWVPRARMLEIHAGRDPEMSAARPGAVARFVIERWLAGALSAPAPWYDPLPASDGGAARPDAPAPAAARAGMGGGRWS